MGNVLRRVTAVLGVALAALVALVGTASASIPDSGGIFHGCVGQVGGYTRLVDADPCISTETSVSWGSGFTDWTSTGASPAVHGREEVN